MAQFELTILTITVSLLLFITGLIFKKKAILLALIGALIMLLFGITAFSDPIEFKSGINITTNQTGNVTQETQTFVYSPQNPTQNTVLAWVFMILGIAGVVISSLLMYNQRFEKMEESFDMGENL